MVADRPDPVAQEHSFEELRVKAADKGPWKYELADVVSASQRSMAVSVIIAAVVVTIFQVSTTVVGFLARPEYLSYVDGTAFSGYPKMHQALETAHNIALLGSYVLVAPFLWRARKAAERLAGMSATFVPRLWVWVSWILPAANLFLPFITVRQIGDSLASNAPNTIAPQRWLWIWWMPFALMILAEGLHDGLFQMYVGSVQLQQSGAQFLTGSQVMGAVASFFAIFACFGWIRVVREMLASLLIAGAEPTTNGQEAA